MTAWVPQAKWQQTRLIRWSVGAADYAVWRKNDGTQDGYNAWRANFGKTLPTVVPLPGDYNNDGIVDAADYVVWRKNDGTQDGYNTWRANLGNSLSGSGSAAEAGELLANVPEPAGWMLLVFAVIVSPLRRVHWRRTMLT